MIRSLKTRKLVIVNYPFLQRKIIKSYFSNLKSFTNSLKQIIIDKKDTKLLATTNIKKKIHPIQKS